MMRVGLVYDLRDSYLARGFSAEAAAEFDDRETIDALTTALTRCGWDVEHIGDVRSLAACLVAGHRWDLVFNIAEGVAGRSREAQVPALLEAFDQPYAFSDPLTMAASLDKAAAKRLVREAGVATPAFAIVRHPEEASVVALPFPVFAKPLAEGSSKGISAASRSDTPAALAAVCAALIERFRQPVLVETLLAGREFTVGLIGSGADAKVIGVLEIALRAGAEPAAYSRFNKVNYREHVALALADDATAADAAGVGLSAWEALGGRDAGRIDVRCDADGRPQFLEANPLPGLHPHDSDLVILAGLAGIDYDALIAAIVAAAADRLGLGREVAGRSSPK